MEAGESMRRFSIPSLRPACLRILQNISYRLITLARASPRMEILLPELLRTTRRTKGLTDSNGSNTTSVTCRTRGLLNTAAGGNGADGALMLTVMAFAGIP